MSVLSRAAKAFRRSAPRADTDEGGRDLLDDLLASQPANSEIAGAETGHGSTNAGRWLARLRAGLPDHIPATTAAAILLAAGAATLFAPLPGSSSPTGLSALTAAPVPKPSDTAPQPDQDLVNADIAAVAAAQLSADDTQAEVTQAEAAREAAAALQTKADDAQSAADSASSSDTSYTVTGDQSTVDYDKQALQGAQDSPKSAQDMLALDQQYGLDTSYDTQAVADARTAIKDAQTTLDTDTVQLAADQSAANSATATAKSQQATADALAGQAKGAQTKADAKLSDAQNSADAAATALSSAQTTQTQHQQSDAAVSAEWHHQHRMAVFAVKARNTTMADYRTAAAKNVTVGGALAASSVILIMLDVLPRRRGSRGEREA